MKMKLPILNNSLLSQFLLDFMSSFFVNFPFPKNFQTQIVNTEKLRKTFSYKKVACKMLVKLTQLELLIAKFFESGQHLTLSDSLSAQPIV